jgi:hypothetical protein
MRRYDHPAAPGGTIETLREFHEVWAYVAIVANAVAGLVALIAYRFTSLRGRRVWGLTIGAEAAMLLEIAVGLILVSGDRYTAARFHVFYGIVTFITIAGAYAYRKSMRGRAELYYGLLGLFIIGLGVRAIFEVTM